MDQRSSTRHNGALSKNRLERALAPIAVGTLAAYFLIATAAGQDLRSAPPDMKVSTGDEKSILSLPSFRAANPDAQAPPMGPAAGKGGIGDFDVLAANATSVSSRLKGAREWLELAQSELEIHWDTDTRRSRFMIELHCSPKNAKPDSKSTTDASNLGSRCIELGILHLMSATFRSTK
jgi:hypothetical protein